jgi:hypothetical protein
MNLDCDHVDGGGTTIPGIGDTIAAESEANSIGIGLLMTIVDVHMPVCDVFALADRDVILSIEDDRVGALANAWDDLGKANEFNCVGLAPEFFVLGAFP